MTRYSPALPRGVYSSRNANKGSGSSDSGSVSSAVEQAARSRLRESETGRKRLLSRKSPPKSRGRRTAVFTANHFLSFLWNRDWDGSSEFRAEGESSEFRVQSSDFFDHQSRSWFLGSLYHLYSVLCTLYSRSRSALLTLFSLTYTSPSPQTAHCTQRWR